MRAPLRLERYFFTRMNIEANQEFDPQQPIPEAGPDVPVGVQLFRHEEDPNRFQVGLVIGGAKPAEGNLPYRIHLEIVGQFALDEGFEHDNREKLVQVNGASMLYSAAREMLLGLTGRGPWPPMLLPSISFLGDN